MIVPPNIEVANLGMADSLILMVMALVVFGPRRLPQIGRQIGKLMYEFRKASNDFKFQMEEELRTAEEADRRKKEEEERQRQLAAANPPAQIEASIPATAETPATPAVDSSDQYAYSYGELTEQQLQTQPTIQPPSTGEQVAANRPTAGASEAETQSSPGQEETASGQNTPEQGTQETATGTNHPAAEDADKTIESAAHNG
jgi:sec-independent protein translocase protein TatB